MKKRIVRAAVALLVVISACSKNPAAPEYQKEVSVYGYLWVGQPLSKEHALSITWTRPIDQYYDPGEAAVKNAHITITEQGSGRVYPLMADLTRPGFFYNDSVLVKSRTRYTLQVQADGRLVTAETTTPDQIDVATALSRESVNTVLPKNLGYEKPVHIECPTSEQMMLVDISCQEAFQDAEYINTFGPHKYPDDQEEYDGGRNGQPKRIQVLVKYSDLVTDEYPDQHVIYWYASMLVFYGRHNMQIMAIDENYHGYLYKENPSLNGGVRGGIGVFGSVSGELFKLQVVKSLAP